MEKELNLLDVKRLKFMNLSQIPYDDRFFLDVKNDNYGFVKPENGGLWATIVTSDYFKNNDWFKYMEEVRMKSRYVYSNIFKLKEDSKILHIKTLRDLNITMDRYTNYEAFKFRKIEEDKEVIDDEIHRSKFARLYTLDYEKLAKDYDGIYIEFNPIYMSCTLPLYFNKEGKNTYTLYGFDISSFILFNKDAVSDMKTIRIYYKNKYNKTEIDYMTQAVGLGIEEINEILEEKIKI